MSFIHGCAVCVCVSVEVFLAFVDKVEWFGPASQQLTSVALGPFVAQLLQTQCLPGHLTHVIMCGQLPSFKFTLARLVSCAPTVSGLAVPTQHQLHV